MIRYFFYIYLILLPFQICAQNIENAVVKISVIKQGYDFSQPWQKSKQSKSFGSGCIIEGNLILTCAHVVEFGEFIEVRRVKDSRKYNASIAFIAPEYDLAILQVEDSNFFRKTTTLPIGDLPSVGDVVKVLGFPTGGNDLSITSGIVSRIENIEFNYNNHKDLGIQIDAAINPGNSGGPVISDTALAGIAFQGRSSGQNIGYMIPTTVIQTFIKDISDGYYEGPVPVLMQWQSLENTALRRCYGIDDFTSGILINDVHYCSALRGVVYPEDILLEVDYKTIQNDGTVYINSNIKTSFSTIIQNKITDDSVVLRLIRSGVDTTIIHCLSFTRNNHLLVPKVDLRPKYFIQGGFIFTTPSYYYFQEDSYWQYYNPLLSNYYYSRTLNSPDMEEVVIISSVLPDQENAGYHDLSNKIVRKVNNLTIRNFNDLIRAFDVATDLHLIEDVDGRKYVISGIDLEERNKKIMDRYGIPKQWRI